MRGGCSCGADPGGTRKLGADERPLALRLSTRRRPSATGLGGGGSRRALVEQSPGWLTEVNAVREPELDCVERRLLNLVDRVARREATGKLLDLAPVSPIVLCVNRHVELDAGRLGRLPH